MQETILNSQEVIDIIPSHLTQLKETLSYIVDQYNGEIVLWYDGREDGFISDISVYSDYLGKRELDVLWSHSGNDRLMGYSKKREKVVFNLEIEL
jgi:hypothetical protein